MHFDAVADLTVDIRDYDLERREGETSSGFTRATTVVTLRGDHETGRGEDVTYETDAHDEFQRGGETLPIPGTYTIDEFSQHLAQLDLFQGGEPDQSIFRNYRRWAFESAALDLALKQAGHSLASQLDREYDPVRFVVSTRLEEPPTGDRVLEWIAHDDSLEFKLDPTTDWTETVMDHLAETGAVRILDLKGQYEDTIVDQPADPALYEQVLERFPEAIIEDPELTDETLPLFDNHEARVSWDYPIRSVETVEALPWEPTWLNIKPSRFGSIRALFDTLDYCADQGIRLYGGGQFELDVGREQLHALASLFYPDTPNDIAPRGYNEPQPRSDVPSSPLEPPAEQHGFGWT